MFSSFSSLFNEFHLPIKLYSRNHLQRIYFLFWCATTAYDPMENSKLTTNYLTYIIFTLYYRNLLPIHRRPKNISTNKKLQNCIGTAVSDIILYSILWKQHENWYTAFTSSLHASFTHKLLYNFIQKKKFHS